MLIKTWHAIVLLTAISCAVVFAEVPRATWASSAALSLALGASALALMAAASLLGGRWKLVESLFGGLDRVYQTHKWLGIWALAFACFHFAFKADLEVWDTAATISLPAFATRLVRQLSLVALMLIIILALNRNIPYSLWRWWHKLSGPLFLIVILHWLSIKSPITLGDPAGIWLGALATLGVAAALYKLLLYPLLSAHAEYRIVAVSPAAAALHLELAPVKRAIPFKAGQFGFIRMKDEGLREPHPFTIASGGRSDGHVHFVIRALGDYTQKLLREATVGMHADIYAPFGRFTRPSMSKREVWIGGGVGISPFIAWLTDPSAGHFDKVTLFYFFTPAREFPKVEILTRLAQERGAELVPVAGGAASPEFAQRLSGIARTAGSTELDISFCGPKGLLRKVRELMRDNGIPESRLRYEYFEFR